MSKRNFCEGGDCLIGRVNVTPTRVPDLLGESNVHLLGKMELFAWAATGKQIVIST